MRMISRAVSVLRALAEHPAGLSLGQIAKETGLARATVQRLVGALAAEKLVCATSGVVGVRLGHELARLGSAVHCDLRGIARPLLQELQARVEDTIDLTALHGDEAIVLDQMASPRGLRVVSHVGMALPVHCTASGKAHLTQMSAADVARLLEGGTLRRYTANTNTDPKALLPLAGTAAARTCQFDLEEYAEGVSAIGLPIRGLASGNYALAISMPSHRLHDRLDMLKAELLWCQGEIERRVGL
jgi:DNA-binding IclR family transcriptional regulator